MLRKYGGKALKNEMQRREEEGVVSTYSSLWQWLCSRYDSDAPIMIREEWRSLRPKFQGKLDLTAWRKYHGTFTRLWAQLRHKTDDEAYEAIMRVLPAPLRERVTLEEEKKGCPSAIGTKKKDGLVEKRDGPSLGRAVH